MANSRRKQYAAALFAALFIAISAGCKGTPKTGDQTPSSVPGSSATAPEGPPVDVPKVLKSRIEEIVRQNFNIPPQVDFKFGSVFSSEVSGLLKGDMTLSLQGRTQNLNYYLSQDQKYLLLGRAIDISQDPAQAVINKIDLSDFPSRGPKDAKVTIIEYSDFQCPYCSKVYATIEGDVLKKFGKKVKFVYKHFPLSIHNWAESAAIGADCAYTQKKEAFWVFYNNLYKNQSSITPQNLREKLLEYAKEAGLTIDTFTKCFDSQATKERVAKQMQEGADVGVQSTPSFFINGQAIRGAQPPEAFEAAIKKALSE